MGGGPDGLVARLVVKLGIVGHERAKFMSTPPRMGRTPEKAPVKPIEDHEFVQRERTSFVALIPNEAIGRSCAICDRPASEHRAASGVQETPKPSRDTVPDDGKLRVMRCPYCGHTVKSGGIGAIYCGPHGNNSPARRMMEVSDE